LDISLWRETESISFPSISTLLASSLVDFPLSIVMFGKLVKISIASSWLDKLILNSTKLGKVDNERATFLNYYIKIVNIDYSKIICFLCLKIFLYLIIFLGLSINICTSRKLLLDKSKFFKFLKNDRFSGSTDKWLFFKLSYMIFISKRKVLIKKSPIMNL